MSAPDTLRVLITGADGYVGRLLTASLADNPAVGAVIASDIAVPSIARRIDGVTYKSLDVRAPDLDGLLGEHRVDVVVHLAAIVSPKPEHTREFLYAVDVDGTKNVLDACVKAGVKKVIVTSSGAAYGYHPENARQLDEDAPLRGNVEFAYSDHKRIVEQMLAEYREEHPQLGQLILRVGTILGDDVKNQITALFEGKVVLGLRGIATPFVFIWDHDLVSIIETGITTVKTGIFNVAGDGSMTLREIATRLKKPYVELPPGLVVAALGVLKRFGLTRYGPEQVRFLRHRPVLNNRRLKADFGYRPRLSSREVFERYRVAAHG